MRHSQVAVLFLGEVVRWRRSLATLVGFCGVMVCVQPGTESFEPWATAALGGALCTAGVSVVIRRLTSTDAPLTTGQWCMVSGLKAGEATAVVPFEYSRLLFAAAFGFVLFAETPATTTWLGGAIIIGTTLYIALREARLARRGTISG